MGASGSLRRIYKQAGTPPDIKKRPVKDVEIETGGGGGIRTLVTRVTGETVFETAAFNHSATPPHGVRAYLITRRWENLAERWGFEPQIRFWRIHDFQSCSFGQLGHLSAYQTDAKRMQRLRSITQPPIKSKGSFPCFLKQSGSLTPATRRHA